MLIITDRYVFHHVSACSTASDVLARVKLRNTCYHRLRYDIYTIRLFHSARQQLRIAGGDSWNLKKNESHYLEYVRLDCYDETNTRGLFNRLKIW